MSKEYIEREAAIEAAKHAWAKGIEPSQYIEIIPTSDVTPVAHGHLVSTGMDELFAEFGNCTKCGGENIIKAKFCNWCGAKMDGEEKSASDGGADKALRGDET